MKSLSIIIPAFNEAKSINKLLEKVITVELINNISKEIIIVDDHSTDETEIVIQPYLKKHDFIRYVRHSKNLGKGAAIHTGIKCSESDLIIIQDADLEYDPAEYNLLLKPIVEYKADVVYGSRFMGGNPHRVMFFWHSIGNRFLTFLSNMFTNLNLTDMETGFKMFRSDILKNVVLKEQRFGFEPEVTAKVSRLPDIKIFEVGISYSGRTYKEGKKINWKDGMRAVFCILKYNV
ncbi:MAG TPA: glycosyltransferase family 2 protein [Flavisolibacter sp.]|jgi:glycosyltransferase involved in cell wall biosynthesis|nr:glycosyltransferase family 2 protein [Flavisolibacter sp.]